MIEVAAGSTVLDSAMAHGLAIATLCGGAMHCKLCRVTVRGRADAASRCGQREQEILERLMAAEDERLACQVRVLGDGLQVLLPDPLERLR